MCLFKILDPPLCSFTWYVVKLQQQHTLTSRCTSRPHSCGMTYTSTVSHQGVACITTVIGCLSKDCPSSVTNLTMSVKRRYTYLSYLMLSIPRNACESDHHCSNRSNKATDIQSGYTLLVPRESYILLQIMCQLGFLIWGSKWGIVMLWEAVASQYKYMQTDRFS